MGKSKVLVVGGTGYVGRRIVRASIEQGHETYVLQRPDIGLDAEKVQMLVSFKKLGAHLVEGSFSDQQSLVDAVKLVDVVICTMSGVHFRSHNLLMQLKLVEAIKAAGNVKVCVICIRYGHILSCSVALCVCIFVALLFLISSNTLRLIDLNSCAIKIWFDLEFSKIYMNFLINQ